MQIIHWISVAKRDSSGFLRGAFGLLIVAIQLFQRGTDYTQLFLDVLASLRGESGISRLGANGFQPRQHKNGTNIEKSIQRKRLSEVQKLADIGSSDHLPNLHLERVTQPLTLKSIGCNQKLQRINCRRARHLVADRTAHDFRRFIAIGMQGQGWGRAETVVRLRRRGSRRRRRCACCQG